MRKDMEKTEKIQAEIDRVKQEIAGIGPMRPGSLSKQKRAWGKTYWHLSYYHRGQGHTAYVSEEQLESVQQALQNYRNFQELCKVLIDYSLEMANLTDRENGS